MRPRHLVLTALYCAGLFWLSSSANPIQVKPAFPGEDKIVHACLYAGLSFVVALGLRQSGKTYGAWTVYLLPIVFASLYGITDEFHQRFVPGRTCDVFDWAADTTGAALMQAAFYAFGPALSRWFKR